MPALTHFAKQDSAVRQTISTGGEELTNYTIAWSDLTGAGFAASDDVLILVGVKTWNTANTNHTYFAVGFGTTFAGRTEDASSVQRAEPVGVTFGDQYMWFDRRTLAANENIYFRGQVSTSTGNYQDFYCLVLKLGGLSSNDWLYAEASHSGNAPATYDTSGAGAATPAAGDWLLFACSRWLVDDATSDMLMAINDGTADIGEVRTEGEHVDEERVFGTIAYKAGLGSGVTARTRYRVDTATSHDAATTKLFGLRLDAFQDHAGAHTTNTVTHTVLDTYSEFAGFGAYGLTTTGPFVVLGFPIHGITNGGQRPQGRIQIAETDWPSAGANQKSVGTNGAVGMRHGPIMLGYAASQSAGTLDIDLDCAEDAVLTGGPQCVEQIAAAFSLTLAAALPVYTQTKFQVFADDGTSLGPPPLENFDEEWTGADGAAWSAARWTTDTAGATAAIDIQSNQGRMAPNTTDTWVRALASSPAYANLDLVVQFTLAGTSDQYHFLTFRHGGTWSGAEPWRPQNGYQVVIWRETGVDHFDLESIVAGTSTPLASPDNKAWGTSAWNLRVRAVGTALKVRAWQGTEPTTWDIEVTNSNHASGVIGLSANSQTSHWDNLHVASI